MTSIAIYGDSGMGKTMIMKRFRGYNPSSFDLGRGALTTPILAMRLFRVKPQAIVDMSFAVAASIAYRIQWLHREFYRDAPQSMLVIQLADRRFTMEPGAWRHTPEHDVAVGRHVPPSSERVADFMRHFESRFRFDHMGKAAQITAIASAHPGLITSIPSPMGTAGPAG